MMATRDDQIGIDIAVFTHTTQKTILKSQKTKRFSLFLRRTRMRPVRPLVCTLLTKLICSPFENSLNIWERRRGKKEKSRRSKIWIKNKTRRRKKIAVNTLAAIHARLPLFSWRCHWRMVPRHGNRIICSSSLSHSSFYSPFSSSGANASYVIWGGGEEGRKCRDWMKN